MYNTNEPSFFDQDVFKQQNFYLTLHIFLYFTYIYLFPPNLTPVAYIVSLP